MKALLLQHCYILGAFGAQHIDKTLRGLVLLYLILTSLFVGFTFICETQKLEERPNVCRFLLGGFLFQLWCCFLLHLQSKQQRADNHIYCSIFIVLNTEKPALRLQQSRVKPYNTRHVTIIYIYGVDSQHKTYKYVAREETWAEVFSGNIPWPDPPWVYQLVVSGPSVPELLEESVDFLARCSACAAGDYVLFHFSYCKAVKDKT